MFDSLLREVSVIIPAHNARAHIAESIQSALDQSFENLEVLVVDNNSTDGTAGIAEQFEDPRIRVLSCNRLGASAARNFGIENSSGTYIQFLDADDLLAPDKIARQLTAIRESDPIGTIASCEWLHFENNPSKAGLFPEAVWTIEDPVEWLICSLSGGGMMQTGAWLVHRDLIMAAGPWDESLSLHDDGEFFTRVLLQAGRQVFVSGARVYYRSVQNSLSRQRTRGAIESAFHVCQSRDRQLLAHRDDSQARAAIATQYAQFAYEFAPVAMDLARLALTRISDLGESPVNTIGGLWFQKLVGVVGFSTAIPLRRSLAQLKSTWPTSIDNA